MHMIFQGWSMSVFQAYQQWSTISSKDLKIRFDNQFCRMNCQIFSWPLSSGARGGSCKSELLFGTLRALAPPPSLIEEENSVSARSDFGCDLIEVKLHSFGVAGRQHEGSAGSAFGADRTKQVGRLGSLIMGSTGA